MMFFYVFAIMPGKQKRAGNQLYFQPADINAFFSI